jgi:hypothetical protein
MKKKIVLSLASPLEEVTRPTHHDEVRACAGTSTIALSCGTHHYPGRDDTKELNPSVATASESTVGMLRNCG